MKNKKNDSNVVVKIIKLQSGETLVAKIKRINDKTVLKDPMTMVYLPFFDKSGNITNTDIAFRDWIEGSVDSEFTIPTSYILVEAEPDNTILKTYRKILMDDKKFFSDEYLKETNDSIDFQEYDKKLDCPDLEKFSDGEDEDDLDTSDWDDIPPRFDK